MMRFRDLHLVDACRVILHESIGQFFWPSSIVQLVERAPLVVLANSVLADIRGSLHAFGKSSY